MLKALAVLVVAAAVSASAAYAQQAKDPIQQFSDIAVKMSTDQKRVCVAPRVNTPEQCTAEFEAALALVAEITGWQVLLAKAMQDNDTDRVAFFQGKHARSVEFGLKVVGEVERRYIPATSSALPQATPVSQQR